MSTRLSVRSTTSVLRSISLVLPLALGCAGAGPSNPGEGEDGGIGGNQDASIRPRDASRPDGTVIIPPYQCVQKKFPVSYSCEGTPGQLGEALQKALWFFHTERCGPQESCGYVQWRGKDHAEDAKISLTDGTDMSAAFIAAHKAILDPDGDGTMDMSGGFHDAGDFIKFGLTQAYSASMMAWSWFEFPSAYKSTGLESELIVLMKMFADFFAKNTYVDASGNLIAYGEQVSDITDHGCGWMPGEVRKTTFCPRKGYFITSERPAADVTAHAAAVLAQTYLMLRETEPTLASSYLDKAVALYKFAGQYPDTVSASPGGLYESEYAYDDLAWAALWLFEATQNDQYLKDVMDVKNGNWVGWATKKMLSISGGPTPYYAGFDWTESHTHCWNSVRSGIFVRMAAIYSARGAGKTAPDPEALMRDGFKKIAFGDSNKWATEGKDSVARTPAGFSVSYTYGSGRYNTAGQMVALVFNKYFPDEGAAFVPWAKRQIAYLLGDNPLQSSYMMGYGPKYESHPHHADGHASIYGDLDKPAENRHILWGALLNGPSAMDDTHNDSRTDFGANEVTIDYNASFVAALAAHHALQGAGQCPLKDWPPTEPRIDEFYTRARVNSAGACNSQVEILMMNESIHPPRYDQHLTARYYFDAREIMEKGIDPTTITAKIIYDRGAQEFGDAVKISGPISCGEGKSTFYVELSYEGFDFWGEIVKCKGPPTTMIELGVPNTAGCTWDPSNDWSYDQLTTQSLKTPFIPVYSSGAIIFGQAPPCGDMPPVIIE